MIQRSQIIQLVLVLCVCECVHVTRAQISLDSNQQTVAGFSNGRLTFCLSTNSWYENEALWLLEADEEIRCSACEVCGAPRGCKGPSMLPFLLHLLSLSFVTRMWRCFWVCMWAFAPWLLRFKWVSPLAASQMEGQTIKKEKATRSCEESTSPAGFLLLDKDVENVLLKPWKQCDTVSCSEFKWLSGASKPKLYPSSVKFKPFYVHVDDFRVWLEPTTKGRSMFMHIKYVFESCIKISLQFMRYFAYRQT